jgi:pimeloyl-ACP methyl ester carboxylesterase
MIKRRPALLLLILLAASAQAASPGGAVDIGGGRKLYLECRGVGTPTVVLIAGKGNGAADWHEVLDPADPVRAAATDMVGAGEGKLHASQSAVFPRVSRFTRVCAYDRPGTRMEGKDASTPVAQPHTVDRAVDDLRRLLVAAGVRGPYVLVAHSYGGLIATLFTRTYPRDVAGIVMVDAATQLMKQVVSPQAFAAWDASNRISPVAGSEAVELADAAVKIDGAPARTALPAVVLSADKPWHSATPGPSDATVQGATVTFANWLSAQDLLAASLGARHITSTHSGHNVYLYQPQMVVDAIRETVDEVRSRQRSTRR